MNEIDIGRVIHQTIDTLNLRAVREFCLPRDTHIGPGALAAIGRAAAGRGIRRPLIVIDAMLDDMQLAAGLYRSLGMENIAYEIFRQKPGETESGTVEEIAASLAASDCDGVLAFGGGSTLDAAKAALMLAANPSLSLGELAGNAPLNGRARPFIAIPTTAGTGSEATRISVVTDTTTHSKYVIVHPDMIPDLALIDACLTLQVPPAITAATGIDALSHAIEAYVSVSATPLTKALAFRAMSLIGEALPIAVGQGRDIEARESMMLASYMAGIAFSNAGLGLAHAMAHRIGPAYGLAHGVANAVTLPSVMRFNLLVCRRAFAEIGLALTGGPVEAEAVIEHIQRLIVEIGLPGNLAQVGGDPADFPGFAEGALQDVCLKTNPRTVNRQQIVEVYQHACARSCPWSLIT